MAQVTLSSGQVVTYDLFRISMREFRALLDSGQPAEEGDATLGKVTGLTADAIADLPQPDYRALVQGFFKAAREPLADPNSVSASS